jgi:hypothetical protein
MTAVAQLRPPARHLSLPLPVELLKDDGNGQAWLKASGEWTRIASLRNLWDFDGYLERAQPVIRMLFQAITADGRRVLLFQDLGSGAWYQQLTLDAVPDSYSAPL